MLIDIGEDRRIEIDYYGEPAEPMTWDSPGYDAYLEITEAIWEDGEELSEEDFDRLEEKMKQAIIDELSEYPPEYSRKRRRLLGC